jgi:branched-chain amino acid transport system permease protein
MIIGLLFMGAVIFLPNGLMGLVRPAVERLLMRKARP